MRCGTKLVAAFCRHRDDYIIGFGHADQQPLFVEGLHRQSVRRDNLHRAAGKLQIEKCRGRTRDDPEPDLFARPGARDCSEAPLRRKRS
jgi:hypothetical protein